MSTAERLSDPGTLANNYIQVMKLQTALSRSHSNLTVVPKLITDIIEEECWRRWQTPEGKKHGWSEKQFREFIEAPRPDGCQTPIEIVRRMLEGTDAWWPFQELTRGERGGPNNPHGRKGAPESEINRDNITVDFGPPIIPLHAEIERKRDYQREAPTGTSTSYTLRRLERSAPELLERVKAGELSPHGAAVKAGLVEPKITLPNHPERAARILGRHFTGDRLNLLIEALERLRNAADQTE